MENRTCDDLPEGFLPTAQDYFKYISVGYIVAISLCGAVTLLVLLSYIESVVFLMRNLGNWKPRDKAIWLLGLYPVLCVTSLFALTIPRTALLNEMVGSIYLSICVYLFVVMLMGHFGGKDKMSKRLRLDDGTKIDPRRPLILCCCRCLPLCDISKFRLRLLEVTVLQFALFKPIYSYITATIWANNGLIDENLQHNLVYIVVSICDVISTLLAGWGFSVIYKISQIPLQKLSIKPKFIILQVVMLISTFQPVFIAVFISVGVIPCNGALTATANGLRWHNMLYIGEMCGLSWFSRYYYRRHVGDMPPEEKVTQETVDQRTSTTETLTRMAQADQILQAGAQNTDKLYRETDRKNKYIQHKKPVTLTRADVGSGISTGTDPIDFDGLKMMGEGRQGHEDMLQSSGGSSSLEGGHGFNTRTSLIGNNTGARNPNEVVLEIK